MLEIDILRIFCDLVETRSFSKTALRHGVSQSAISQQLSRLESEQKGLLLDRQSRPFELTHAGQMFYDTAKDMIARYDQFTSDLAATRKSARDRVTIAAIFSIGIYTLPPYVRTFLTRYPDLGIHLEYAAADQVRDSVLKGLADIGLMAIPRRDRNFDLYPFQSEPLVVVCPAGHPLTASALDIKTLCAYKFIAFEKHIPTRQFIDTLLADRAVTLSPVMEYDNVETIKHAIEINDAFSILPRVTVARELDNGTLSALSFDDPAFVRPTGIITRRSRPISKAAKYFLELLQNHWLDHRSL